MIDLKRILHDGKSSAFFSFLIGLGVVVLLFHKPYGGQKQLSVPVSDIEGKIIQNGGKCYTYTAEDSLCSVVNKDGRRSN